MTDLINKSAASPPIHPKNVFYTVSVVITTFNQSQFLGEAISSALNQSRPPDEIIVVDDGSTDDPAAVVAGFQGVDLIRQENRGLSAARNAGLRKCSTNHIIFLDADDRLLPTAIAAGLACAAEHPECAFVYGGFRYIEKGGRALGPDSYTPVNGDAHLALLRENLIRMHATVVYLRDRLLGVSGFDESLRRCEDYDVYLRIAQRHPITGHAAIVAEYRKHGLNMSSDPIEMLRWALIVLDRHEARISVGTVERAALRDGRAAWRSHYVSDDACTTILVRWRAHSSIRPILKDLFRLARLSPLATVRVLIRLLGRRLRKVLPPNIVRTIEVLRRQPGPLPIGSVRFGDLKRQSPISDNFGFDRGSPIDRYYIEKFLAANVSKIRGRVLEVGDNVYTLRFGGARVERSEILHIDGTSPRANFIGSLENLNVLPAESFDCIVLTQTLHLVFDMRAAIETLYRALTPGGALLLTTPGISQIDRGEWGATWFWSLTAAAAQRLLEERFRPNDVTVETCGNVFAAIAFLHGLAMEEVDTACLDTVDATYPVVVTARAIRGPAV